MQQAPVFPPHHNAATRSIESLIFLSLILIGVTIVVNAAARLLVWRITRSFRAAGSG